MTITTREKVPDFRRHVEKIIANTASREDFLKVKEEWYATKGIVDFIAKSLSSFPDSVYGETPTLNLSELDEKERNLFPSVIRNLFRHGIVDYARPTSAAVITTAWVEDMLAGKNVRVESRPAFEEYRTSVLNACNWIKKNERVFKKSLSQKWPSRFEVNVKDREIWINDFLLSKPHGAGVNLAFFEYVIKHPNEDIAREKLPAHAKRAVRGDKGFSKVLNELGFKGEILKTFFPNRGKSTLLFRKRVATKQLVQDGINVDSLLQELRKAHGRHNPK